MSESTSSRPKRGRWTIRTRLIITLAVVVSAVIITVATIMTLAVRDYLQDRISNRLASSAERIRAGVVGSKGLTLKLDTVAGMARAESTAVVVVTPAEPLWTNTDADTARSLLAADLRDGEPKPIADRPGLLAVRLDTVGIGLVIRDGNQTVNVDALIIAVDASADLATFQTMVLATTAGVLVCIVLLVLLTILIVGRGLRPLQTMADDARAFAEGDRTRRLPVDLDDPDISRLALTVNQAFDAQQQAEDRLRAFVADASHELRTPLTTATGWVELYFQGGLDDPELRDRAMQRVETQLGRIRVLIDELSLLARLDRARPLNADPVDLTALTAEVVEDARVINPDRDFTFASSGPAPLVGDAQKLQQVVLNLLGNAVQHTPAGTPVEIAVIPAEPLVNGAPTGQRDTPCWSPIMDRAFLGKINNTSSNGSGAAIPAGTGTPAAPDSASRSWRPSWPRTVARRGSRAWSDAAPPSASRFPPPRWRSRRRRTRCHEVERSPHSPDEGGYQSDRHRLYQWTILIN